MRGNCHLCRFSQCWEESHYTRLSKQTQRRLPASFSAGLLSTQRQQQQQRFLEWHCLMFDDIIGNINLQLISLKGAKNNFFRDCRINKEKGVRILCDCRWGNGSVFQWDQFHSSTGGKKQRSRTGVLYPEDKPKSPCNGKMLCSVYLG